METVKLFTRAMLVASLLLVSNTSVYAGELSISDQLTITAINGKSHTPHHVINLKQGKNLVELKYDGIFPSYSDDTDVRVTSGRLYLTLNVNDNQDYQIQMNQIDSEIKAKQFITTPSIYLVDEQGKRKEQALLNQNELITQLFLIM